MGTDTSVWDYTIRLGTGEHPELGEAVTVFQVADELGDPVYEGYADDVQSAIVKVAQALLNVHDQA